MTLFGLFHEDSAVVDSPCPSKPPSGHCCCNLVLSFEWETYYTQRRALKFQEVTMPLVVQQPCCLVKPLNLRLETDEFLGVTRCLASLVIIMMLVASRFTIWLSSFSGTKGERATTSNARAVILCCAALSSIVGTFTYTDTHLSRA